MDLRPKTIICDIDGTLLPHVVPPDISPISIGGTTEKLQEWDLKGYNIILITGRRESQRMLVEETLENLGIFYDQLIMGVGGGDRILINDKKADGRKTAFSINLERNQGINDITL